MSSDWPLVRIDEIKAQRPGSLAIGPFGSRMKSDCYVSHGIRVVRGTNLTGGRSFSGEFVFITPAKADELGSANLLSGDLVFPHRGAIGEVGLTPNDGKRYVLSSSLMKLTCAPDWVHPDFIYYYFKSDTGRFELLKNASQVGTPGIGQPLSSLKQITLRLPCVAEQRRIAGVLRSIDGRIDLLRETNATLEAIAQALFKSWFVDFDPVRAKQQGLAAPGMDKSTAALFPDRFHEAVPSGWRAMMLSDAFDLNPPRSLVKGTVAPYLDMASLATSGHCVETPLPRSFSSGSKFRNGDSLLARITPCLENGKSAFVDFLADGEVGWGSTEFIVLRPKAPLPVYFGYLLCRHPPFREHAIHSMAGTSGRQRVQNDVLGRYMLAVPDPAVASAFGALVEPLQRRIAANHAVGRTLTTLRDTLLPRLISGQLRIPEAEAQVAEAIA